ncbi:MAG TPA: hypothetical protein DHV95_01015 [Faecalibacterium sp.]|nr:hypothetical protein [Faecalibacterium sp.]
MKKVVEWGQEKEKQAHPLSFACAQQLPQRGSPWQKRKLCVDCQSLSLWERWHCVSNDGEGEDADPMPSYLRIEPDKYKGEYYNGKRSKNQCHAHSGAREGTLHRPRVRS